MFLGTTIATVCCFGKELLCLSIIILHFWLSSSCTHAARHPTSGAFAAPHHADQPQGGVKTNTALEAKWLWEKV